MKLVLDAEDLSSLPDAIRDALFLHLAEKTLIGGVTRPDPRLDGDFPASLTNFPDGKTLIDAMSVEAAIALIEGLGNRSVNLLKAMVALGANSGVKREKLMDCPEFELKFKDGRSLNGVLTAIRKRFRQLIQESEPHRQSVSILEYDDYLDTYFMREGTYSALREAIEYVDGKRHQGRKLKRSTISLYLKSAGTILPEFSFGGSHTTRETILVLPSTLSAGSQPGVSLPFQEHFNFNGNWVLYGTSTENGNDA